MASLKLDVRGLVLGRHDGKVAAVAVCDDAGEPTIVSAGADGAIRRWPSTLVASGGPAWTALDAAGSVVLAGGDDGTIRLWDGPGRAHSFSAHDGAVVAVRLARAAGAAVILSAGADGTVRMWDLESRRQLRTLQVGQAHTDAPEWGRGVGCAAFGQVDERLVVVTAGWKAMYVWDLGADEPMLALPHDHDHVISDVAVGRRRGRPVILSASNDDVVVAFDLTGRLLWAWAGHEEWASRVAAGTAAGREVAVSGGNHGELIVRNMESGAPYRARLLEHETEVTALSLRSVGGSPVIASGSRDGAVHLQQPH